MRGKKEAALGCIEHGIGLLIILLACAMCYKMERGEPLGSYGPAKPGMSAPPIPSEVPSHGE
jgi:hypothetical protein